MRVMRVCSDRSFPSGEEIRFLSDILDNLADEPNDFLISLERDLY